MTPETRYARNGDVTIAWSATAARPIDLVMVLGTISHLEVMREDAGMAAFLDRVASFARVINLDRRGLGLSDGVDGPITLEDEASDIEAVLDAAGSERAVVFGYAAGGPPALSFAATRPERVQALVLYAAMAAVDTGDEEGFGLSPAGRVALFERMAAAWGSGADADLVAPSRAGDPALRAWLGRMERASLSPGAVRRYAEQVSGQDARDVLERLRVPTLVLHRAGDRMFDVRHSRLLAARIPGARLVELAGADHLANGGDQVALLGEVEEFLTGSRRGAIERELLTVLFTDIADATGHAARVGDARWRELLGAHDAAVRRELERFGGREVKTIGDAFLATFPGPPSAAVRCAEAVVRAVRVLGLDVRAGLHTGECEVVGDDVGGMAVHIAARVAALAAPGEVLVSGTTYGTVVGAGLAFEDRGAQALRGVPGRWPLFALDGLR